MNNNYKYVIAFLLILMVVGGVIVLSGRKTSKNQSLASSPPSSTIEPTMEPTDKLLIQDEVVGTGVEAVSGKKVTVNYVGTLTDGTKFDSSFDRNEPFAFNLGAGEVIQGWDQGVIGMKVGGKRKLTIPSSLGYGAQGVPGAIPGNATLIFEIELLKVE